VAKSKWMQAVRNKMEAKGTVGSFSKKAKQHNETTSEYANEVSRPGSKATTKTKKQANLAKVFAKARKNR